MWQRMARITSIALRAQMAEAVVGREELRRELEEAEARVANLAAERDASARDRDALRMTLASETVSFPDAWSAQADDGGDRSAIEWWRDGRTFVSVPNGSEEWQWCSELLRSTLPTATLVRLERWENRLQFRDYWVRRRRIALKRDGESNERWLWHGTGRTPPATVLAHEVGPDPRFASGGFYGKA